MERGEINGDVNGILFLIKKGKPVNKMCSGSLLKLSV